MLSPSLGGLSRTASTPMTVMCRTPTTATATASSTNIPNQHRRPAQHKRAAMRCHVAHPGRRHAPDQDARRAKRDQVRGADAYAHVGYPRRWQAANNHGRTPRAGDRATNVRNDARHHRTHMHVGQTCCRFPHRYGSPDYVFARNATNDAMSSLATGVPPPRLSSPGRTTPRPGNCADARRPARRRPIWYWARW